MKAMITKKFRARAFGDEEFINQGVTKLENLLKEKLEQMEALNYQNWKGKYSEHFDQRLHDLKAALPDRIHNFYDYTLLT